MIRSALMFLTALFVAVALTACSRASRQAAPLRAGDPIPAFRMHLRRPGGEEVTLGTDPYWLSDWPEDGQRWRWTILAFFPQAFAPASIRFLKALRDVAPELDHLGAQVFAISTDRASVLRGFADSLELPFPLLCDPGGRTARSFGVFSPGTGYPRCATFILDWGEIAHIAHGFDPTDHGERLVSLVKRLDLQGGWPWGFRGPQGGWHIDWGRHPAEGGLFVTIFGHQRMADCGDALAEGELPISWNQKIVQSFSSMRELLRERSNPLRYPDEFLPDGVTPRPPFPGGAGDIRYPSLQTLYLNCEWDAPFGWIQAIIHLASRLPDEEWSSAVASSPLIGNFHLYTDSGGIRFSLPQDQGLPDPNTKAAAHTELVLRVPESEWSKPPPLRRVSFSIASQERPLGFCSGVDAPGHQWDRLRLSLDPPDTIDRVKAALRKNGLRKGDHLAIACSPRVSYGLVFGVLDHLYDYLPSFPAPPGLFADLEAGRIR